MHDLLLLDCHHCIADIIDIGVPLKDDTDSTIVTHRFCHCDALTIDHSNSTTCQTSQARDDQLFSMPGQRSKSCIHVDCCHSLSKQKINRDRIHGNHIKPNTCSIKNKNVTTLNITPLVTQLHVTAALSQPRVNEQNNNSKQKAAAEHLHMTSPRCQMSSL